MISILYCVLALLTFLAYMMSLFEPSERYIMYFGQNLLKPEFYRSIVHCKMPISGGIGSI